MANEIQQKLKVTSTELAITLASLASSTSGVGRQGTIVDNTVNRYAEILVWAYIKQGTSPTGNRKGLLYLIRDDDNGHRDDGAGASDAGITILNAPLVSVGVNKSSPATGEVIYFPTTRIIQPGPKWTLALVHDTAVNLNVTESNSKIFYVGILPEIQ